MRIVGLIVAAVALSGVAVAAESPFVGAWKMNVAKSQFTGDTMTFTKTATGYHTGDPGPTPFDFSDDGKDYPIVANRTTSWTRNGDGSWTIMVKAGTKPLVKIHRQLSADGATMSSTYEEYRADGSVVHEADVYKRVSGTTGLEGKWEDVKVDAATETLMISMTNPHTFKMSYPASGVVVVTHGDGSPAPVSGSTVPPGAMAAFKSEDPMTMSYTNTLSGKVMGAGTMMVSSDGHTLTDTSWTAGKEAEKQVSVYDKQ